MSDWPTDVFEKRLSDKLPRKKILFVGPHGPVYELVADFIGVDYEICDSEPEALLKAPTFDGVVTGFVGRTPGWFHFLQHDYAKPAVCFTTMVMDIHEFREAYPQVTLIEKGLSSGELEYLQSCLMLKAV